MKAIRVRAFGEPDVLQSTTVPDPSPGPGQVLVRIAAAGVNPVETYIRSGKYARLPALPYTPGTDAAGVIFQVGTGVPASLKAGQRVWLSGSVTGTYADVALCELAQVHHLPDRVTFPQGAAIGVPYATAYRALFHRGAARPGETILIHGATGGTGIAALQLARMFGLRILATGGTEAGRKLIVEQGGEAFDHSNPTYLEEILAATGGRGVDLIVEMLANVNLARDLTLLARGGRISVVGSRGTVEINPRDAMAREADIRGVFLNAASTAESGEAWAAIDAGLLTGILAPIVAEEIPLADAARGHEAVMASGHRGKIVLRCSDL